MALFVALLAPTACGQPSASTSSPLPSVTERWILLGDSIQSSVVERDGSSQARDLSANRISQRVNIVIQNISSPGLSMATRHVAANTFPGAIDRVDMIDQIDGFFGAKGLVITLGTNDWANQDVTLSAFRDGYARYVSHARALELNVVCVAPIWRGDKDTKIAHVDSSYVLSDFSAAVREACTASGGKFVEGMEAPVRDDRYFGDAKPPALHLNTKGHEVFSDWLIAQMNSLGYWR